MAALLSAMGFASRECYQATLVDTIIKQRIFMKTKRLFNHSRSFIQMKRQVELETQNFKSQPDHQEIQADNPQ